MHLHLQLPVYDANGVSLRLLYPAEAVRTAARYMMISKLPWSSCMLLILCPMVYVNASNGHFAAMHMLVFVFCLLLSCTVDFQPPGKLAALTAIG